MFAYSLKIRIVRYFYFGPLNHISRQLWGTTQCGLFRVRGNDVFYQAHGIELGKLNPECIVTPITPCISNQIRTFHDRLAISSRKAKFHLGRWNFVPLYLWLLVHCDGNELLVLYKCFQAVVLSIVTHFNGSINGWLPLMFARNFHHKHHEYFHKPVKRYFFFFFGRIDSEFCHILIMQLTSASLTSVSFFLRHSFKRRVSVSKVTQLKSHPLWKKPWSSYLTYYKF